MTDLARRQAIAAEHVARRQAEGQMSMLDPAVWESQVVAHLTPLDPARPWRLRRGRHATSHVRVLVPAVAERLTPPAGTRPQPQCPMACFVTHAFEETG